MFQSLWSLRNAVLAAILLAMTADPGVRAARDYRGGYQDARGNYHSGNEDFGYPYNGGYYPAPGYYPTDPVILTSPYYSTHSYPPSYYSSPYTQSYYYTPASTRKTTRPQRSRSTFQRTHKSGSMMRRRSSGVNRGRSTLRLWTAAKHTTTPSGHAGMTTAR